jgi:hypothetical protein
MTTRNLHPARRAKENSPAIHRWVCAPPCQSPVRDERVSANWITLRLPIQAPDPITTNPAPKSDQVRAGHTFEPELKKHIVQVTVCKSVTLAAKTSKRSGRIAIGFPLPSTGRGIEGEGWSSPAPPPARASDGGRSRATTPFACGAGTLWPGFAAGLRMTLLPSKQPSFPKASTAETSRPHAIPWAVGRVTPCAPRLPPAGAKFPRHRLPDLLPSKTLLEFPAPTSEFGFSPSPSQSESVRPLSAPIHPSTAKSHPVVVVNTFQAEFRSGP